MYHKVTPSEYILYILLSVVGERRQRLYFSDQGSNGDESLGAFDVQSVVAPSLSDQGPVSCCDLILSMGYVDGSRLLTL